VCRHPKSHVITIDTDRKTIMVDDYDSVPFLGESSKNTIAFMPSTPSDFGVSTGTLNQVTGETSVHIIRDGLQILSGMCKPARKLF
jgi:hypothetical protein